MLLVQLDLLGDLFSIIGGSIAGIPTLVLMAIPFIIGLIIGWFIKKTLKIAIIAAIIAVILVYFGFFGLSSSGLGGLATQYGGIIIQGAILLFGILPIGIGLIIGVILGFIIG